MPAQNLKAIVGALAMAGVFFALQIFMGAT